MQNKFSLLFVLLLSSALIQTAFSKSLSENGSDNYDDYYQGDDFEYEDDDEIKSSEATPPEPSLDEDALKNPPYFEKPLVNIHAQPGDDVLLNCDARNYGIRNLVVWYKDDVMITTGQHSLNERFEIMRNNSLLMRDVNAVDDGQYVCEVLPQKIRMKTVFSVSGSLVIELDGRDYTDSAVTLKQGERHVLECKTFLPTKTRITWSLNGQRAESFVTQVEGNKLIIDGLEDDQAGIYQCLADDGTSDPPHGSLTIDVQYRPKASTHRHFVNAEAGGHADLACEYKANPIAVTHWFKNTKRLHYSEKYSMRNQMHHARNETILTVKNVNSHDLGEYECYVENVLGSTSLKVHLIFEPEHPQFEDMEINGNRVILHWLVRSLQPLSEAVLDYKLNGSFTWSTATVIKTQRHHELSGIWKITHEMDLQPGQWFTKVKVKNTIGWSKFSAQHSFEIPKQPNEDYDDEQSGEEPRVIYAHMLPEIEDGSPLDNLMKAGIGSSSANNKNTNNNGNNSSPPVQLPASLFSVSLLLIAAQYLVPRF